MKLVHNSLKLGCTFVLLIAFVYQARIEAQTAGTVRYLSNIVEFYDGSAWRSTDNGDTTVSCSVPGTIRYNSGSTRGEFCNGTTWRRMNAAGTTAGAGVGGEMRYHSGTSQLQIHNGTDWVHAYAAPSIAVVRTTSKISASGVNTSSGSFAALPSAGNMIVVTVTNWNGANDGVITAVTDNQGNTYTSAVAQTYDGPAAQVAIFYAASIGTPTGTFTVTIDPQQSANNYIEWNAIEVSGVTTFDRPAQWSGTSGSVAVGPTATTTSANEIVFAVAGVSATDTNLNFTTAATGYTAIGVNHDSNSTIGYQSAYKIISSTGTQSASWTHDPSGGFGIAGVIATFK